MGKEKITLLLKLGRFLAAGVPAFVVAVLVNRWLVELLHWPAPAAYALALYLQMTANFFVCRLFVFDIDPTKPVFRQYLHFLAGLLVFRLADWAVYTVLVEVAGVYYLAAQLINIAIFSLARFKFLSALFESPRQLGAPE